MITGLHLPLPRWTDLGRAVTLPLSGLWTALRRWYRRQCDLRHVAELDDYLLRDVGFTREQLRREMS